MRPLSRITPKPMLPIGDRPLVAHVADAAVDAGAEALVFVVGDACSHLESYFGDEYRSVPVSYAVQDPPAGTADAVRCAMPYVDGPFAVLNGDNLFESAAIARLFEHEAAVLAHRVADPREYGVLSTDGRYVTGIVEKPEHPPSDLANAGAYVFPASMRDAFDVARSSRGEYEITDAIETLIEEFDVVAVETDRWLDVARPHDFVHANELLLGDDDADFDAVDRGDGVFVDATAQIDPSATLVGPVLIGADVTVGPDAVVRGPSVLGAGSTVGAGSELERSMLFPGAHVGSDVILGRVVLGPRCDLSSGACIVGDVREGETTSLVATHEPLGGSLAY